MPDAIPSERQREVWIPVLCFTFCMTAAVLLTAAVVITPWFEPHTVDLTGPARLINGDRSLRGLYARDTTVRRVSLAAAAGLTATAFIFFRPAGWFRKRETKADSPGSIAGA